MLQRFAVYGHSGVKDADQAWTDSKIKLKTSRKEKTTPTNSHARLSSRLLKKHFDE
jgi:hypothetical protein